MVGKSKKCTKFRKFNLTLSDFYRKVGSSKALILSLDPRPKKVQNIFSTLEKGGKQNYLHYERHNRLYQEIRKKVKLSKDTIILD